MFLRKMVNLYKKGALVEVSSDEEGFKDARYEATIIKSPWKANFGRRKTRPLVQYKTLVTDEDKSQPLKEYVSEAFLRPMPPRITRSYELYDIVDAFFRDGWWKGAVTKVDLENSMFTVFFENPPDEVEFSGADLRVHFDWVKGKWVEAGKRQGTSQQKGRVNSGNKRERGPSKVLAKRLHAFVEGKESNEAVGYSDEMAVTDCTILPTTTGKISQQKSGMTSEMKRKGRLPKILFKKLDAPVEGKQHSEAVGVSGDMVLNGCTKLLTTTGEISQQKGGISSEMRRKGMPSVVLAKRLKASAEGKEHNEAVGASGEMLVKICSKLPTITGEVNQQKEGGMSNEMKRKGTPSKLPVKRLKASAEGKEHTEAVGGASGEMVIEDHSRLLTITRVEHTEAVGGVSGEMVIEDHSRLLTITGEISQERVGGVSSEVKRKGRPSNVSVERLEAQAEGNDPNEAVGASGGMVVEEPSKLSASTGETCQEKVGGSTSQKKRRGRPPKVLVAGMKGSRPKITIKLPSKEYLKKIREQKQLPVRSTKLNNKGSDIKRISSLKKVKLPKEIAGQVLRKHIDKHSSKRGIKSSKTKNIKPLTQDSEEALGEKVAEISQTEKILSSNISEDDQPLLLMWYKGMNCQNDEDDSRLSLGRTNEQLNEGTSDKNRSLSFVKRSPVWTTLESLEVFQKMPQSPHFQPLDSQKEEFREGLAVADMVNFSNLVSKTSELQITDPRSTFSSSLEALLPLEMNGFDVKAVRERLNKLLSMKISQEHHQDQSKQVGSQIAELIREKINIDAENEEREKKIREVLEKRASLMSRRDVNDFEINTWKSSLNVINEDIRSAKAEFERMVAAPW